VMDARRQVNDSFGWFGIVRLGLVQASLGAMVVLTTSTLNRVMVVELALPALLPGILVALHYAVQLLRPRMGFGSDVGGRRTPWIVGGLAVLALGAIGAAAATAWMGSHTTPGIAAAVLAFMVVGVGVSAAGTNTLVLLAKRVPEGRRAAAATIVWMMMIFGFAFTAGIAGKLLDPYSPARLVAVMAGVCAVAFCIALVALRGLEGPALTPALSRKREREQDGSFHSLPLAGQDWGEGLEAPPRPPRFREALAQVWAEPEARHFTVFIFVSMLAFSAQDLILEPFAGTVFGWTPGQTTQLSGLQHGGVLAGMLLVAIAGSGLLGRRFGSLRAWTVGGCIASGIALAGLVAAGVVGPAWPLAATVFLLGAANGAFSIAAIGSMMALVGQGRQRREGTRMGLWGAAQAIAFGCGGIVGTGASDIARWLIGSPAAAYATVFALEALLFLWAARLAWRIAVPEARAVGADCNHEDSFRTPAEVTS
jgi:MFS transporter, BCD family, chlorophyll transporter